MTTFEQVNQFLDLNATPLAAYSWAEYQRAGDGIIVVDEDGKWHYRTTEFFTDRLREDGQDLPPSFFLMMEYDPTEQFVISYPSPVGGIFVQRIKPTIPPPMAGDVTEYRLVDPDEDTP